MVLFLSLKPGCNVRWGLGPVCSFWAATWKFGLVNVVQMSGVTCMVMPLGVVLYGILQYKIRSLTIWDGNPSSEVSLVQNLNLFHTEQNCMNNMVWLVWFFLLVYRTETGNKVIKTSGCSYWKKRQPQVVERTLFDLNNWIFFKRVIYLEIEILFAVIEAFSENNLLTPQICL